MTLSRGQVPEQVRRSSRAPTTFFSVLTVLTLALASGCGDGNENDIAGLERRIIGLERETENLDDKLQTATRERNRAQAQLRAVQSELNQMEPLDSENIDFDETCGTPPGGGAFGYTRVKGIACDDGEAITSGAIEAFCATRNLCRLDTDASAPYVGEIEYEGWTCEVEDGWESTKTACVSGEAVIVTESGA